MFAQHYNVPHLLDDDASSYQTLGCCRTFDMDLAELRRQYPMNELNQTTYGELILLAERPLLLKVIRFAQENVQQMLNVTTTSVTSKVDVPINEAGVLRHKEFASRDANRRIYSITNRRRTSIRDGTTDMEGRTE